MSMLEAQRHTVRQTTATMLRDDAFQRAPKMARLFEYLVDKALLDEAERPLSGYEVGIEALGKPADFDPSTDAGVGVETARLRRILGAYNAEHTNSSCIITLPKGTYRPYFNHTPESSTRPLITHPSSGPSIGVLPFTTDFVQKTTPLSLAVREELLDELYRYREFHVIDASCATSTDPAVAEAACRALDYEFMLSASLSEQASLTSIDISVIDLDTQRIGWKHRARFDSTKSDIFQFTHELADVLARQLAPPVGSLPLNALQKRLGRNTAIDSASGCVMLWHLYRLRDRNLETYQVLWQRLQELLAHDPFFALGLTMQAMLLVDRVAYHLILSEDSAVTLGRARYLASQAISMDHEYAYAHYVLGQCSYFSGDIKTFNQHAQTALELHPRNADLVHHIGAFTYLSGESEYGQALLDRAGLAYHSALGYRLGHVLAAYDQNELTRAVDLLETTFIPSEFHAGKMLAALIYGATGNRSLALEKLQRSGDAGHYTEPEMLAMADLWIKDVNLHNKICNVYSHLAESL